MNDSTNICLACGLCCDGTLIGHVQLANEELAAVKEVMEIEESHGHGFFLQPCKKFCNGCAIYDKRPNHCASFECQLLKSVDQKKLEFDTAVEITKVVKQQKISLEQKLSILNIELKSNSFYFKMAELKRILQKNKVQLIASQKQLELLVDIERFESLLLDKFGISMD